MWTGGGMMGSWGKNKHIKWLEQFFSGFQRVRRPQVVQWKKRGSGLHYRKQDRSFSSQDQRPMRVKASLTPFQKFKRKLFFSVIAILLVTVPIFIFFEANLREPLMHVSKIRMKQIATQAINEAITKQVVEQANAEQLIDWKMDAAGKVSGFVLNYGEHMRITSSTVETVQSTLQNLNHIPEKIPIGHALNSAFISNYGPKVPIEIEPLGAVKVELNTREKNAAINMVLVEVYIRIVTEIAVVIPFDSEPDLVEAEIPISYLLVVGDVPMYYYDSSGRAVGEDAAQAPNIAVPLHDWQEKGISVPNTSGPAH